MATMALTKEDIVRVANLAHLALSEEEIAQYQEQLSSVLDYMKVLDEVDVSHMPITAQVTGLEDVFREDSVVDCPKDQQEEIMGQFPAKADGGVEVPAVFE